MMKRKHNEYRPNTSFRRDENTNRMQYFGDPRLASRVKQYMKSNKDKSYICIATMSQYLQSTYSEYERKKQIPFQKTVEKAYNYLKNLETKNVETQDGASRLEEKHQQKRMKQKVVEISSDSSDSFSEGNQEYTEHKDQNTLNSFMSSMYKNSPRRSVSQPNSRNPSAPASPMRADLVASDTDVIFMIDRTGNKGALSPQKEKVGNLDVGFKHNKVVTEAKSSTSDMLKECTSKLEIQSDSPFHNVENPEGNEQSNKLDQITRKQSSPKKQETDNLKRTTPGTGTEKKQMDRKKKKAKEEGKEFRKKLGLTDDDDKKKGAEVSRSSVKFSDVGGNDRTLKEICKLLVHMKHPEIYQQLGVTPPRGFLLHGPPGCGKTLLAQAIAGELELPLMKLASTEIVSGVSGESEEKIRDVFDKAVANAPCVLFLDEIDAITPKRETASKDMERRIVSQLLTCLDDLNTHSTAHVLVIGATNRPDSIDPGLRRAGRFDREISLGIPDEHSRMRILEVLCRGLKLETGFNFHTLARSTPGFVGADLMALAREAAMTAVNRVFHDLEIKKMNKNTKDCEFSSPESTKMPCSEALITPTDSSQKVGSDTNISYNHNETIPKDSCQEVVSETNMADPNDQIMDSIDNILNEDETSAQIRILKGQAKENSQDDKITGTQLSSTELYDKLEHSESTQSAKPSFASHHSNTAESASNNTDIDKSSRIITSPDGDNDLKSVLSWLRDQPPLSEDELKNLYITMGDFMDALKVVQPSAKREGFATIPDVTWEDIGALRDVREELQMCILGPVRYPEQFREMGLTSPPGILLAGPPGCGKTLLAKAVANESGVNFISVKGPELLNMYVGESERAVRQVFQRARNSAPCVIFFDELDALCPRRSHSGEGGSSVRVVNQLLTEMDGLEERKQVFIMAATNRPDIIDPAVLRPGRLDKTLYVGLPSAQDRLDILNTVTKNGTKPKLHSDIDLHQVANSERCDGFTGADLAALVREASVSALREFMTVTPSSGRIEVHTKHFESAFTKVKPSVSAKDQLIYTEMKMRVQK